MEKSLLHISYSKLLKTNGRWLKSWRLIKCGWRLIEGGWRLIEGAWSLGD